MLDFVNTHEKIAQSFSAFYEQTYLAQESNIERIYELKSNLLEYEVYAQDEIDIFVESILRQEKENIIHSQLDRMVDRFNQKSDDEKIEFYSKVKNYLKDYAFLAQILPYEDTNLEKHYILLKKLIAKIHPPRSEDLAKGILDNVSFDGYRVQLVKSEDIRLEGNGELLPSNADGSSKTQEAELQELSSIIKEFNEKYGNTEWGEIDKVAQELIQVKNELSQNEKLKEIAHNTDKQNMQIKFKEILSEKFQDVAERNLVLFQQFLRSRELLSLWELLSRSRGKLIKILKIVVFISTS